MSQPRKPRRENDSRKQDDAQRRQGKRPRPKPNATPDDLAFGINACDAAIDAGVARSLLYLEGTRNERVVEVATKASAAGIATEAVPQERLDELTGGGVHQGVLVRLRALPEADLRRIAEDADGPSLVLLLDGVTDPQNLGAVLRTAVAVGVAGVVLPRRRGATLTPGVHRASAGLSFAAPVTAPRNLAQAVDLLQSGGFWVVAADQAEDSHDATTFDWPEKTALVLGGEAEGVSHLLSQKSDFHVTLPMDPRVESLNVGVAAGALCYLWRRQWPAGNETPGNAAGNV